MHSLWILIGPLLVVASTVVGRREYNSGDKVVVQNCGNKFHSHSIGSDGVRIVEDSFGEAIQPDTQETVAVRRFTLSNQRGVNIQIITYGATMTSIVVPDRNGHSEDVLLGFDNIDGYTDTIDRAYFGATLGRVCNRIGNASFKLDGIIYHLSANDNGNTLHGGNVGFDKFIWNARVDGNKVIMNHVNPDGFEGFPGAVDATVTFELTNENHFRVRYEATATKPTPINLSNHAYFNLAGHNRGSAELYKHLLEINADAITVTDDEQIPTGQLENVTGTPYDLREPRLAVDVITAVPRAGLDDNYCVNQEYQGLNFVGSVVHPESGRQLRMYCDQPGVQVYTSNNLPDPENNIYPPGKAHLPQAPNGKKAIIGKGGALYLKHGAFCLETLKYPDAVNHRNFESTIVRPGQTYQHNVHYVFSTV